nr:hypothetical protein [Tanacetum cinerariifolium]
METDGIYLEALEPIPYRWMYPFERYMKKLKIYVRNKANPEGSIAEGYVAEEVLTFCSYYFWGITMKFNCHDRNVDCPPPTCQFQVFRSIFRTIGNRSLIQLDHQEMKKVIWYILHNSPKIDTYLAEFEREFPNKYMKQEFPGLFEPHIRQRYIDKDLSLTDELFALACGPSPTLILVNSCVVDGLRVVIVVEYDHDVIHDNNSSDLALSTNGVHHDLQDFDDEDLVNDEDDDEVATVNYSSDEEMSAAVAHGHGGDGSDDDPFSPPPRPIVIDCLAIKEGMRGCRDGGRKGVRKETRNLELKKYVDEYCPLKIMFEYNDKGTMLHVGKNTAR